MSDEQPVDCRAAFEKWNAGRGVDIEIDKDGWGRPRYKHSHVDAMWHGFQRGWNARAPMRESGSPPRNPVKTGLD